MGSDKREQPAQRTGLVDELIGATENDGYDLGQKMRDTENAQAHAEEDRAAQLLRETGADPYFSQHEPQLKAAEFKSGWDATLFRARLQGWRLREKERRDREGDW